MELLLEIMRSRGKKDEGCKAILASNKNLIKKYMNLLDAIFRIAISEGIALKFRIRFQIDKLVFFFSPPDLIYPLRIPPTGESGENTLLSQEAIMKTNILPPPSHRQIFERGSNPHLFSILEKMQRNIISLGFKWSKEI